MHIQDVNKFNTIWKLFRNEGGMWLPLEKNGDLDKDETFGIL